MADPFIIIDRRQLLTGVCASALAAGVFASTPLTAAETAAFDPAYAAYLHARKAEAALDGYRGPADGYYPDLAIAYMKAQEAMAATPSASLYGVRCKMKWYADSENWREGDGLFESLLGLSILKDLDRMTAGERGAS